MKDSKFIELLNLYVDHQISESDAALLEAEIHRDPERREIYRQYCQMQKACVMLADSFRTEAPVGGKILEFAPPRHRLRAVAYGVGGMAAAACLALVMVGRSTFSQRTNANAVAEPVAVVQTAAEEAKVAPMPLPARVALQPVFAGVVKDAAETVVASTNGDELDWMTRVQFQRVPASQELWFESRPTIQPQDLHFPARSGNAEQAEDIAFRFQR